MEKKGSVKKKKTKKGDEENKEQVVKGGPYRNIEECKKHLVTSFPDIKKIQVQKDTDFIIVACDGIWDCFTNEQAVKYVRNKREKGPKNG